MSMAAGRLAVVFITSSALFGASAIATPARQQQPTFRLNVNLVALDVSVVGKDGMPIRGLEAKDFTVFEDGKPQTVAAFEAVDVSGAPPPAAGAPTARWLEQVPSDVDTNQLDDRRLVLIVLDDATLIQGADSKGTLCPSLVAPSPLASAGGRGGQRGESQGARGCPDPQAEEKAREAARLVVDQLGPNDLASITYTDLSTPPLDFTRARAKLLAAVDDFGMKSFPTCDTFTRMLRTLKATTDYMVSIQNRRKTMIYIGGGIPLDWDRQELMIPVPDASPACGPTLIDSLREVFVSAQRSNVAISTIDPFGLRAYLLPNSASLAEVESSRVIAANTGGRAVVNTNDFTKDVAEIFRENSSYYMLGYAPANAREDGSTRKIEVNVDRPGAEVRTRTTYIAPGGPRLAPKPPPDDSVSVLAHVLPVADLPLSLVAAPGKSATGRSSVALTVAVGAGHEAGDELDVSVAALDPFGNTKATSRKTFRIDAAAGAEARRSSIVATVEVGPGMYEFLVGVSSRASGKTGSVYGDVIVPNFDKDAVSLSGVVLASTAGTPTTDRVFGQADRITAFVQVYQGRGAALKPSVVVMSIIDDEDHVVVSASATLSAERFDVGTRGSPLRFPLPLDTLRPGRYLLQFDTVLGKMSARRALPFSVRAASR